MTEKPTHPSADQPAAPRQPVAQAAPILHRYDPRQPVLLPEALVAQTRAKTAVVPGAPAVETPAPATVPATRPAEIGGPSGPEPTRYGDWERNGRVSDF